jgi:hypothetical protein
MRPRFGYEMLGCMTYTKSSLVKGEVRPEVYHLVADAIRGAVDAADG